DRMAERVVDVLEMIDVEEDQRPLRRFGGVEALDHLVAQLEPIGQAGERVVVCQVRDPRLGLVALERQNAELDAGPYHLLVPDAGSTLLAEVKGEGAGDAAVTQLDRARPAGLEAERQSEGLEVCPQRIGLDVVDGHRFAAPRTGAAGAGNRTG